MISDSGVVIAKKELVTVQVYYWMPDYNNIIQEFLWQTLDITLYDPIVPSAAQAVMDWVRLHHESVTGRDGYSDFYKKNITFNVLGPVGDVVEEWELKGAFIQSANFGDLAFDSSDPVEISLTLRYDYAILKF